jgi:hypothetical protein
VLSAIVPAGAAAYRTPPWLADRAAGGELSWRVAALDLRGEEIRESAWRRFTIRGDAPVETPDDVPAPGTSAGPGG